MVLDYGRSQLWLESGRCWVKQPRGLVSNAIGGEGDKGKRTLGAEELARDVERLAADNDDLLAVKELLGHDTSEATKKVALAIDDDLARIAGQLPLPSPGWCCP